MRSNNQWKAQQLIRLAELCDSEQRGKKLMYMEIAEDLLLNEEPEDDEETISDPFAIAVVKLVKHNGEWEGNATQLLLDASYFADKNVVTSGMWPTSRTARKRLKWMNPILNKEFILYVEWESRKYKTLKLTPISEQEE